MAEPEDTIDASAEEPPMLAGVAVLALLWLAIFAQVAFDWLPGAGVEFFYFIFVVMLIFGAWVYAAAAVLARGIPVRVALALVVWASAAYCGGLVEENGGPYFVAAQLLSGETDFGSGHFNAAASGTTTVSGMDALMEDW